MCARTITSSAGSVATGPPSRVNGCSLTWLWSNTHRYSNSPAGVTTSHQSTNESQPVSGLATVTSNRNAPSGPLTSTSTICAPRACASLAGAVVGVAAPPQAASNTHAAVRTTAARDVARLTGGEPTPVASGKPRWTCRGRQLPIDSRDPSGTCGPPRRPGRSLQRAAQR